MSSEKSWRCRHETEAFFSSAYTKKKGGGAGGAEIPNFLPDAAIIARLPIEQAKILGSRHHEQPTKSYKKSAFIKEIKINL